MVAPGRTSGTLWGRNLNSMVPPAVQGGLAHLEHEIMKRPTKLHGFMPHALVLDVGVYKKQGVPDRVNFPCQLVSHSVPKPPKFYRTSLL
jgi:hypothetical protein